MNSQTLDQHIAQLCEQYSCDTCEVTADEPIVKHHRYTAISGWQIYCRQCACFKNPTTGKFDIPRANDNLGRPRGARPRKDQTYSADISTK